MREKNRGFEWIRKIPVYVKLFIIGMMFVMSTIFDHTLFGFSRFLLGYIIILMGAVLSIGEQKGDENVQR